MIYKKLAHTELQVSLICLGTMTWGEQNSEQEAHEQLNYALSEGVNFIDTAEMYPVPPKAETYATTERYIGSWLKQRQKRDDVILASKIAGPSRGNDGDYIRNGSRFNRQQIIQACHDSLKRLNTDYLDIYQLHWPERSVNYFGVLGLTELNDPEWVTPIEETIEALSQLKKEGKIRYYGLSNETPWGLMKHLQLKNNELELVSIQNPYNLLNRSYEVGLSEISLRENIGLLAYSPLAFGLLSGKYLAPKSAWDLNWRLAKYERFQRYNKPRANEAVLKYSEIAKQANLSLTQLALTFVNQQKFVTANIIGATNLTQLKENISSVNIQLHSEIIHAINQIHAEISNPCP